MHYCLRYVWAFKSKTEHTISGSFMHDNDGFASLNKDLFTVRCSRRSHLSRSHATERFWCIIWHHHDFSFAASSIRQNEMYKARMSACNDIVIDSKTKSERYENFLDINFCIFVSDSRFSVFPLPQLKRQVPVKRREREIDRNLIFVIFDQQEVFLSPLFILCLLSSATQWEPMP